MQKKLGPITRNEAIEIDKLYVEFTEKNDWSSPAFKHVTDFFVWDDNGPAGKHKFKRGQLVLTVAFWNRKQYIIAKISSCKASWQNEDGPVVRVQDEHGSWRVDGDTYCVPVK